MTCFWRQLARFRTWRREWWRKLNELLSAKTFSRKAVLATALFAVACVSAVITTNTPDSSRLLTNRLSPANYDPQTPEERELFKNLRPATTDEEELIARRVGDQEGMGTLRNVMYIAMRDITLPPKRMALAVIIALPGGVRWVSGPLTNQTLLFTNMAFDSPVLQAAMGRPVRNPLCMPDVPYMVDYEAAKTCDAAFLKPATPEQMHANLRRLDPSEFGQHPALSHVPQLRPVTEVYITTGDVRLAPYVESLAKAPIILLARSHRVLGGQLGMGMVLSDFDHIRSRRQHFATMLDPVYDLAKWWGYPDFVCPSMSETVQQQYYPGVC